MKDTTQPQKLRALQASLKYGVSRGSIWNYAKQGLITPIKVTRGVTVFDVAELDKFFSQNQTA